MSSELVPSDPRDENAVTTAINSIKRRHAQTIEYISKILDGLDIEHTVDNYEIRFQNVILNVELPVAVVALNTVNVRNPTIELHHRHAETVTFDSYHRQNIIAYLANLSVKGLYP